MRIASIDGRAALVVGAPGAEQAVDVATASEGRFGPSPREVYDHWTEFVAWAAKADTDGGEPIDRARLDAPSPDPRQVFGIGLNYSDHAAESGFDVPTDLPPTFTKYVSSFSGPDSTVTLPRGSHTDWEAELVVVIGTQAKDVDEASAWDHVAGVTVGQDISERITQQRGPAPQFGLGKSYPGFSPQGPWLVTPDELPDRDDLAIGCEIDGEVVQEARTSQLIFSVARLISHLSRNVTLLPGDVIFTGTPSGVGLGRSPQRFLQDGEHLRTWVEGIGELHQTFTAAKEA